MTLISTPMPGQLVYDVEIKAQFDHVAYAGILAERVGGKVQYIYKNFQGFTIFGISEADAKKLREMPEVQSVTRSAPGVFERPAPVPRA